MGTSLLKWGALADEVLSVWGVHSSCAVSQRISAHVAHADRVLHRIDNSASALTEARATVPRGGQPKRTGSSVNGHKLSVQLNSVVSKLAKGLAAVVEMSSDTRARSLEKWAHEGA